MRSVAASVVAVCLMALPLTACGTTQSNTLVVATHDSWAMPKPVIKAFEKKTGITVKIEQQGDAGELTNKLVLTKDAPIADVAYGVDNTFASRAVAAGVFEGYRPAHEPASAKRFALPSNADMLTPVDYGDVCVNVDDAWFAKHKLAEPRTLTDLTKPQYKNLFVTPGATTSSPGLAFLIATIKAEGASWPAYWKKLMANGTKVDSGWEDAYEVDFTAGGGNGTRPIVLSYSSSPPFTIPKGQTKPTTSALLGTCFRQVEYVGVVSGTPHQKQAREFVDFMQSKQVQATLPDNMYVYPADTTVPLPSDWAKYAPVAPHPYAATPDEITQNRDAWLRTWRDIATS
jgi:thiamine transport system substrate-binding protein